jgi:cellulose synthase/poly-beta-1,6-N-acetylglucosamine synthase-like glycosyltransferase
MMTEAVSFGLPAVERKRMQPIALLLMATAGLLTVPVTVFFIEVLAASVLPQRRSIAPNGAYSVAVLVPAHNESVGSLPTLADISAQLGPTDRLLVIADNCTDDTNLVAATAGAEVINRHESQRIGKGYALAWGLRHLEANPPDIVIVIDADCRLADGLIPQLAATCALTGRPTQALYLLVAPKDSTRVAEFAWRVKNWVRPLGLLALGLPCQLMGSGMAFPWRVIQAINLANESIVEDMRLTLDLAKAGYAPLFCPNVRVTSAFPVSVKGIKSQRRRWEQGHLAIIFTMVPRLLVAAIRQTNFSLLVLALDVAVPPLSFLAILVAGVSVVAALTMLFGLPGTAAFVSLGNVATFTVGVILCWLKCGREVLSPKAMLLIAPYVIGKLPLYGRILLQKTHLQWIRSDRS